MDFDVEALLRVGITHGQLEFIRLRVLQESHTLWGNSKCEAFWEQEQ